MASTTNAIEGFGPPPGLQDILKKQEIQFDLFQQENLRNNASLRREIDLLKQRLSHLENQPLSNQTRIIASLNSYAEMERMGEHESLNKDNINSLASKYPSDPNADTSNGEIMSESNKSTYDVLNEQFLALKIDYQVLQYKTDNPNYSIANNAGELTRSQVEKSELERQVGELRQELQLSRDDVLTLRARNEHLELKEDRLNNLENQISNLEATYAALQVQYNEVLRNNGALERQIRELKEELREARGGAEAPLDRTLERSRQEVARLENALRQREDQAQRNEQAIAALQQDNQRFQRELLRLEKENDEILKKNEAKEELLQSLLDDKQYFSAKLETQERTIAELRPLADAADNSQKRCHNLEIEISDLELSCQTKCSEYSLVIEQRNKLYNHCDLQNKELLDMRMGVHSYENAIKERDAKLRMAKENDEEFQTKIDTHSVSHQYLQGELNNRERECQDKEAELQKARADLEKKDREIAELRRNLEARKNLENPVLNPYMIPYGHSGASAYLPPASSSYYNSPES